MARVKLEPAVVEERKFKAEVRPELVADKCDGCGKVFQMREFCNEEGRGTLNGTFVDCAVVDGKSVGNGFWATVCSFQCAHRLFAEGGWKKLPDFKPFADQDIQLGRAELTVTAFVVGEEELRKEHAKKKRRPRVLRDEEVDES